MSADITSDDADSALGKSLSAERVTVGDTTTQRAKVGDLLQARRELRSEAARAAGLRPFVSGIDMSGAV